MKRQGQTPRAGERAARQDPAATASKGRKSLMAEKSLGKG